MATEEELEEAKREAELKRIKRKSRIDGINDYVQYISGRLSGVVGAAYGACEILSPDTIPYQTPHPEWILGAGLSVLAGKAVSKVVIEAIRKLVKKDDE